MINNNVFNIIFIGFLFGEWGISPVPVAVISVPVAAVGSRRAVTGPAGPVPSIVTHGTRIGSAAVSIGAGVGASAALDIGRRGSAVVVEAGRPGAVVRGLKQAHELYNVHDMYTTQSALSDS